MGNTESADERPRTASPEAEDEDMAEEEQSAAGASSSETAGKPPLARKRDTLESTPELADDDASMISGKDAAEAQENTSSNSTMKLPTRPPKGVTVAVVLPELTEKERRVAEKLMRDLKRKEKANKLRFKKLSKPAAVVEISDEDEDDEEDKPLALRRANKGKEMIRERAQEEETRGRLTARRASDDEGRPSSSTLAKPPISGVKPLSRAPSLESAASGVSSGSEKKSSASLLTQKPKPKAEVPDLTIAADMSGTQKSFAQKSCCFQSCGRKSSCTGKRRYSLGPVDAGCRVREVETRSSERLAEAEKRAGNFTCSTQEKGRRRHAHSQNPR